MVHTTLISDLTWLVCALWIMWSNSNTIVFHASGLLPSSYVCAWVSYVLPVPFLLFDFVSQLLPFLFYSITPFIYRHNSFFSVMSCPSYISEDCCVSLSTLLSAGFLSPRRYTSLFQPFISPWTRKLEANRWNQHTLLLDRGPCYRLVLFQWCVILLVSDFF